MYNSGRWLGPQGPIFSISEMVLTPSPGMCPPTPQYPQPAFCSRGHFSRHSDISQLKNLNGPGGRNPSGFQPPLPRNPLPPPPPTLACKTKIILGRFQKMSVAYNYSRHPSEIKVITLDANHLATNQAVGGAHGGPAGAQPALHREKHNSS